MKVFSRTAVSGHGMTTELSLKEQHLTIIFNTLSQ